MKELNDVGKELPTRAGELEVNKEKNRYPHILPCKYQVCVCWGAFNHCLMNCY